jgi:hypothetical protein
MARGGRGLLKVSLGSAMPYLSTPCKQPLLKRPHGRFRGDRPQGERPVAILLPPWIPHVVRLRGGREGEGEKGKRKGKERRGKHGRMTRGGHGLFKVSLGPTMPYLSTPFGQPPLKRPQGHFRVAACRVSGHLITPLDAPCRTPLGIGEGKANK